MGRAAGRPAPAGRPRPGRGRGRVRKFEGPMGERNGVRVQRIDSPLDPVSVEVERAAVDQLGPTVDQGESQLVVSGLHVQQDGGHGLGPPEGPGGCVLYEVEADEAGRRTGARRTDRSLGRPYPLVPWPRSETPGLRCGSPRATGGRRAGRPPRVGTGTTSAGREGVAGGPTTAAVSPRRRRPRAGSR